MQVSSRLALLILFLPGPIASIIMANGLAIMASPILSCNWSQGPRITRRIFLDAAMKPNSSKPKIIKNTTGPGSPFTRLTRQSGGEVIRIHFSASVLHCSITRTIRRKTKADLPLIPRLSVLMIVVPLIKPKLTWVLLSISQGTGKTIRCCQAGVPMYIYNGGRDVDWTTRH